MASTDAIVLGAGPGALAIAAALSQESLRVLVLSINDRRTIWPYTYGIWGEEVDELRMDHLLEHRWSNTVSFFGTGSSNPNDEKNKETKHKRDYGLFDKKKLQNFWLEQCDSASVSWNLGEAHSLETDNLLSTVTTKEGKTYQARIVIDATGYEPIFIKSDRTDPIAVQTCYGVVGLFNNPPVKEGQFVLMDYRSDHLTKEEKSEPPTFLYAMDMGEGRFFLEETSLGLAPPLSIEKLRSRLKKKTR